jgi:hypothetical protein
MPGIRATSSPYEGAQVMLKRKNVVMWSVYPGLRFAYPGLVLCNRFAVFQKHR